MLSSVTLNFELKKVVLSSCLARLLLVPVHFIESDTVRLFESEVKFK